jgi:hypothetical protein
VTPGTCQDWLRLRLLVSEYVPGITKPKQSSSSFTSLRASIRFNLAVGPFGTGSMEILTYFALNVLIDLPGQDAA